MKAIALAVSVGVGLASISVARADEDGYRLIIKDHKFQPTELTVPAGQKVKLVVENQDATAEEFESHELNREKVVGANASIIVWVGPLDAGRYPFFGDFHQDSAQGALIAR